MYVPKNFLLSYDFRPVHLCLQLEPEYMVLHICESSKLNK